jgi:hypothetical protein
MSKPSRGARIVDSVRKEMQEFGVIPTSTEEEILHLVEQTADLIESLQSQVDREGQTITTATGTLKIHPALVEMRSQRAALARLLSSIYIGDSTEGAKNPRKQRAARRRWDKAS